MNKELEKVALSKYPVDKQVITTADGHEIHYDENEGLRYAYTQGVLESVNEITRLKKERAELIKQLREFISLHEKGLLPNTFTYEDAKMTLNGMGE